MHRLPLRLSLRRFAGCALGAALVLVGGCVGDDGSGGLDPGAVLVRDSAGVVIVEHGPLVVEDSTSWVADLERRVVIGRDDGSPDALFGQVAGFVPLANGRVMVGDGIGPHLRVFEADGTFSETVGRAGSGPGEFRDLAGVRAFRGDSVVVVDFEGSRWSVLDPDGRFVRHQFPTVSGWDRPGSSPILLGFFDDGTALLGMTRSWERTEIAVDAGNPVRLEALDADFVRADAEGAILADFGTHNMDRSVRLSVGGRFVSWDGLRRPGMRAVRGEHVWFADPESGEIKVYNADGTLERIVRVTLPEARASPAAVIQARRGGRTVGADEESANVFDRLVAVTPPPDRLPAFGDLAVDPSGNLWLRPYPADRPDPEEQAAGVRWYVLDAEGTLLRALRLPSIIQATGVVVSSPPTLVLGDDWVLARHRGQLGVETVWRVPLRKNGAGVARRQP